MSNGQALWTAQRIGGSAWLGYGPWGHHGHARSTVTRFNSPSSILIPGSSRRATALLTYIRPTAAVFGQPQLGHPYMQDVPTHVVTGAVDTALCSTALLVFTHTGSFRSSVRRASVYQARGNATMMYMGMSTLLVGADPETRGARCEPTHDQHLCHNVTFQMIAVLDWFSLGLSQVLDRQPRDSRLCGLVPPVGGELSLHSCCSCERRLHSCAKIDHSPPSLVQTRARAGQSTMLDPSARGFGPVGHGPWPLEPQPFPH